MSGGLTLYMVWKGVGSDSRLFFATTSAGADLRIQQWSDQSVIPNVGSIVEPALAGFRSQLYLAWRGLDDDQRLYYSRSSDSGSTWQPQQPAFENQGSFFAPSLSVFQDKLYMAWRGIQDDHGLYFGSFDGNGWSFLGKIADVGSWDTPALANYQNKLYMAWRGIPGDSDLYYSAFDGHDWFPKPQQLIPDRGSALGPSLAVVGQRLHMAWRGIDSVDGNDYHLYHSVFDGTWSPPVRTDFISYMKPSISYYGVDNFGMAWRGLGPGDSDQTFYFTRFDGVNWQVPVKHLSDRGSWNTPTIATYT
jgi:hypothetical protein